FFKLLVPSQDIKVKYSKTPADDHTLKTHEQLLQPGQEQLQPLDIPVERQKELLAQAEGYVKLVSGDAQLDDENAIAILNCVMSREGRWAIRQLPQYSDTSDITPSAIHRKLQSHFADRGAYEAAVAARLIGGDRVRKTGRQFVGQ